MLKNMNDNTVAENVSWLVNTLLVPEEPYRNSHFRLDLQNHWSDFVQTL